MTNLFKILGNLRPHNEGPSYITRHWPTLYAKSWSLPKILLRRAAIILNQSLVHLEPTLYPIGIQGKLAYTVSACSDRHLRLHSGVIDFLY